MTRVKRKTEIVHYRVTMGTWVPNDPDNEEAGDRPIDLGSATFDTIEDANAFVVKAHSVGIGCNITEGPPYFVDIPGLNEREQRIRKEFEVRWRQEAYERAVKKKRQAEHQARATHHFDVLHKQQAYRKAADLLDANHRFPQAARWLRGHAESMVIPPAPLVL